MNLFFEKKALLRIALPAFLAIAASDASATGSLFRSYVSGNGLDTNPCTLPAPCRLLPAALAATQDHGEVWMLDSANYNTGPVTINQSVTILAIPGALGSVLATGGDAIDITAINNAQITLRNLVIRNLGGQNSGVSVTGTSAQLIVEGSEFSDLRYGVFVNATGARAAINHSVFRNNDIGVYVGTPTGAASTGSVDHCAISGGSEGVEASQSTISVSHSSISKAINGIEAQGGSTILLEDNVIGYNNYAVFLNGGAGKTTGSNTFEFNAYGDVLAGTLTTLAHQ